MKTRLDVFLVADGRVQSRQRAKALIMAGKVSVNGQVFDKPGRPVSEADEIVVLASDQPYVSRGGLKIEKALYEFRVNVSGRVCMDVGASTGGFTDCLLQNGAAHVYAIDVGYGQLAWKLRVDSRVTVIERTNIRTLNPDAIQEPVDLAAIDVSFISLRIVIPAVLQYLKPQGTIIALIKPQFEIGKGMVGKGGVVRDAAQHQMVVDGISNFCRQTGLSVLSVIPSPIKGPKGNTEFLIHLTSNPALHRK
ncbi:MAG: TlyA family RNA methyltransferase [Deltaproteobacteria bacterium]|jgi:23S rRNA (cytidine1920-2'-O)/16S rRNA (cytidine1409-2'-O)-methyltransferase